MLIESLKILGTMLLMGGGVALAFLLLALPVILYGDYYWEIHWKLRTPLAYLITLWYLFLFAILLYYSGVRSPF